MVLGVTVALSQHHGPFPRGHSPGLGQMGSHSSHGVPQRAPLFTHSTGSSAAWQVGFLIFWKSLPLHGALILCSSSSRSQWARSWCLRLARWSLSPCHLPLLLSLSLCCFLLFSLALFVHPSLSLPLSGRSRSDFCARGWAYYLIPIRLPRGPRGLWSWMGAGRNGRGAHSLGLLSWGCTQAAWVCHWSLDAQGV